MKNTVLFIFLGLHFLVFGQYQQGIDFTHAEVFVRPIPKEKQVKGTVTYEFKALQDKDSVFLDARNMSFSTVLLNGKKVRYSNTGKTIVIRKKLKSGHSYKLKLAYEAQPEQAVYFINWDDHLSDNNQIWTQGQGKYTSHWLPGFDDMNEKVEFDLTITFDPEYTIIANGKLTDTHLNDSLKTWSFDMDNPMSSYLLAFVIGNYDSKILTSASGVPVELYYAPEDSLRVEPTYRYTKQIFDFLEKEIGVAYPWQNYKQVPVRDFLYAGMENTGTTLFSDGYVIDSTAFIDKNYVNVNAHELAHQWFGNLVTEKDGNHHWLHEGFATYYAYLAEREVFGDEYFSWKLYESAKALERLSEDGQGEALRNPDASSLTFYEKGAWALHMLRMKVGDSLFKRGIKAYLEKFQYANVTIEDFLEVMERVSGSDLSDFEELWLISADFPFDKARQHLKEFSGSIRDFLELQRELTTSKVANEEIISRYWDRSESDYFKKYVILHYHKSLSPQFLKKVFANGNVLVRKALATSLKDIPSGLEEEFVSLLKDNSYVTIESALYTLWIHNPEERIKYLDTTKEVIGFPDKNVRLLWLLLATLTKDYGDENSRSEYASELMGYTSPENSFEVRQNAFALITEVFTLPDEGLKDLVNASVHHSWQFRQYARDLLGRIMKDEKQKERVVRLSQELNGEELRYIRGKLESE
jgi:aminopeptidase N